MSQSHVETKPSEIKDDILLDCLEQLERALAGEFVGEECAWTRHVWSGLARLGRVLRQHVAIAQAPDGPATSEELANTPTLMRRWDDLTQQDRNHGERLAALKWEMYLAAQACPVELPAFGYTITVAEDSEKRPTPDLANLRRRIGQLVADIRQHRETEAGLILDSVNCDIGGGD
jgi:hypothetical protein